MSNQTYYVKCSTQEERDSLLAYAVKRGANERFDTTERSMPDVILQGGYVWDTLYLGTEPILLTPDSFRRQVRKLWPSKRVPQKAERKPKARKPSQLDRIENHIKSQDETLIALLHRLIAGQNKMMENDIDTHAKVDALSQPKVEQAAPQPESLRPGDYTDASKETADALTAMGYSGMTATTYLHNFIGWAYGGIIEARGGLIDKGYITPATFLSRAAVTAKEIGLVPVEPWVPKVGDWVVYTDSDYIGIKAGNLATVSKVNGKVVDVMFNGTRYVALEGQYRPATDAEIAAHLAEQEAKKPMEHYVTRVTGPKGYEFRVISGPDCDGDYELHRIDTDRGSARLYAKRHEFTVIDPQP